MYPPTASSRLVLLIMFVVFGWMAEVPRASEILDRGLRLRTGRFGRRMLKIAGALKKALRRKKRDENESVRSAFGRGVGFYIGEPCENVCNNILFEVYCNRTSGRCECHDHYPVNIENRICVKAARLGDSCKHDDACAFFDDNAVCTGTCRCSDGYQPSQHVKGASICLPASSVTFLENSYLMTSVSAVAGLVIVTALLCLVLRLFSKARFDRPSDRMASAGSPPTMLSAFTGSHVLESRRPSRASSGASTDYLPTSRRASYSMLAPPSSLGLPCSNCKCESSKQSHIANTEILGNFLIEEDDEELSYQENYPVRTGRGRFYHSNPASSITRQPRLHTTPRSTGECSRTEKRNLRKSRTFEHRSEHRKGDFK